MRWSRAFIPTLKEDPTDAEVISHKLLVRSGMIRQVTRGIYDFLPLGLKVVRRIERIVREEMDRAGAQEVLLPISSPAELWRESGRWELYGKELVRFKDRHERDFCLGPTHEEVITDLIRRDIRSYRELPMNLYQIQIKFRDEVRPRFGLMRGREFVMKDAYSFHMDVEDCRREYQNMFEVYKKIFSRCGLRFSPVEADTGAIGGTLSHEFQVLAESGEDALVNCNQCDYAANIQKAEVQRQPPSGRSLTETPPPVKKVSTPGKKSVAEVSEFLDLPPEKFIKTLIYKMDENELIAVLLRGDHEMNELKLQKFLACQELRLADDGEVGGTAQLSPGFLGPIELRLPMVADHAVQGMQGVVTGANENNYHFVEVDQERDFTVSAFADLRMAKPGDPCPRCEGGILEGHRGIEVGQIFYLGTKYSEAMGATYLDAEGRERPIEMGCYGIGITRLLAAAIEQNHDEHGIIWPLSIAPFQILLLPINYREETIKVAADNLYQKLSDKGFDVLLDDRNERPGVKFKDADLVGIPLRVTIGAKALQKECVELRRRLGGKTVEIPVADGPQRIQAIVAEGFKRLTNRSALELVRSPRSVRDRLILALDLDDVERVKRLVSLLAGEVGMFKVGKQLFLHAGPPIVKAIQDLGGRVFLDLKFHDIPTTVAKAAVEAARLRIAMLDVHASGSLEMMSRTVREVNRVCRQERLARPILLAVTVLTSLTKNDLTRVGVDGEVIDQVVRLALLSREAGMDGVVASPHEVARIRAACGRRFIIVSPGIRPEGRSHNDQKRVVTPGEAMRVGADYIVVGRPVTEAKDPLKGAREILAHMAEMH